MEQIDKIVFGDNQFFGINHRSQEKAEELLKRFSDINNIFSVYDTAFDCGINAVMLNSHERAAQITEHFRSNKSKYGNVAWYPSIPYPHKYASAVNEMGILPAVSDMIFKGNTAGGVISMLAKGSSAVFGKDALKMMEMLIDVEFKMFKGLDVKVLFLQNVIADMIMGFDVKEAFEHYCEYVRKKYKVIPGFITLNMPYMKAKFEQWGIEEVVICSSINKGGFNMFPSREKYEEVIAANDPEKYQLMAMSTLASGSISAPQAYEYVNNLNIQSVVFGASSRKNIEQTVSLIDLK